MAKSIGYLMGVDTVENQIYFLYNSKKYDMGQISSKVVDPLLQQVCGKYEDLSEHTEFKSITANMEGYKVSSRTDKRITASTIARFAKKNRLNLERLAEDTYFVKSLRNLR